MKNVQIIILAAGKGTRMGSDQPKALVEINGRSLLERLLGTISTLDLSNPPIIVVGYKKEKIIERFGNEFTYVEQIEQLGTGHAVMVTEEQVKRSVDTIIVLYADQPLISRETILKMIDQQRKTNAQIVITRTKVPDYNGWYNLFYKYGRIIRNTNGDIVGVVECKDLNEKDRDIKEVITGYFAFDAKWLWKGLNKLNNKNAQKEYYLTYLVNVALSENKKVECVSIPPEEALAANSKEELEILGKFAI